MKNRIFVSIVDETSSKQYNLHKVTKKLALYCALGLIVLVFGGFFLMNYLMGQVQQIYQVKISLIEKYRSIYLQNQKLKEQINAKSLELIDVSKKVLDLEEILDFSKNRETPTSEEEVTQVPNLQDQLFLLQIIPSGSPLKEFKQIVSSKERLHPLKNKYGVDSGIDFLVPQGSPVFATADGIVELSRQDRGIRGYGKFIKITHSYGFSSMYGHLSNILIKKGEFVKKGQIIGYSGKSGLSAGERLYYEIRFLGSYQDALSFVQWGRDNFESIFQKKSNVRWNQLLWAIEDLKQLHAYLLLERRE